MDSFFDSLEQKYAKKQKSSCKAGGSKNKTSGGKGTRGKNIVHDIIALCCCLVILVFVKQFSLRMPLHTPVLNYFLMNENLRTLAL